MFSIIDRTLRSIFSYIYRALLLTYSFCLIALEPNFFSLRYYILGSITYVLVFLVFKIRFSNGLLRFFCDYIFISFVVYGRDITHFSNYFLIILPLINAQNHSGKKNGYYTYPVICLLIVFLSENQNNFLLYAPLFVCLIIELFIRLRDNIRQVNEITVQIIDNFYAKYITRKDVYSIYQDLISGFKKHRITKYLDIDSIITLGIKDEDFIIVNSSKPILEYQIIEAPKILNELQENKGLLNKAVSINKQSTSNTFFIMIKGIERKYIFLIIFSKQKRSIIRLINLIITEHLILIPSFKHLSKLFEVQYQIVLSKNKNLDVLKSSQQYVSKANEVMHFIKNSLSPIKGAITTADLYFDSIAKNDGNADFLLDSFKKQKKMAQDEIKNIIERSNFILEKTKNPFEATDIRTYSLLTIIDITRKKWESENLPNQVFFNQYTTVHLFDLEQENCLVDYDTFYLIVSNIISNINHSKINPELTFNLYNEKVTIIFQNTLKASVLEPTRKIVNNYNDDKRNEINQRKSHGFSHLKRYIESIGAESSLDIVDNQFFVFKLTLQLIIDNESSNL